jgi:acyl-coenzyme A synthetase/AMP-(fatty) acid ligase
MIDNHHYPLLGCTDQQRILIWYRDQPLSHGQFIRQVQALASQLPQHRHAINLCNSPYLFLLGFAAALLRQQTNLLPPDRLSDTIRTVAADYPDCYVLTDTQLEPALTTTLALPCFTVIANDRADINQEMKPADIKGSHIAAVLFTSGSTGRPQAFPKPWSTLVLGAQANARVSLRSDSHPALIGTVPPQHSYGLETLVMLSLQGYCSVYSERPFFPQDIALALNNVPAPRVLVTTPVHLRALAESTPALPQLAAIWSATAPLSTELAARSERLFNTKLHEIFGCTETGTFATRRTARSEPWQLMSEFEMRSDSDLSGSLISATHLPASATLQDQIKRIDARQFRLVGRGADLINIAGKRASLADLNSRLLTIPGVIDGVIFMPDVDSDPNHAVARTAALVVAPDLSREQLLSALRAKMDAAFLPRPLFLVLALPRNDVTKLPRAAVLNLFAELQHGAG